MRSLQALGLPAIAEQLRCGQITARELMEYCVANHARTEEALGAYKTWAGDNAFDVSGAVDQLLQNRYDLGPLMGIPTSVKDMFGVPGMPIFAGTVAALPEKYTKAGRLIQTLIEQCAPFTGKTHTVEFAFGGIGMNGHWQTPRNPWDTRTHRIPGGSSSGAGVSLSQGSAFLALGTDTAGSVRIPASFTGNAGLKTTAGRWPTDGTIPLSYTFDTAGLLARTVEDLAFGFLAIENKLKNQESSLPELHGLTGMRLGVPENYFWDGVDSSIGQVIEQSIRKLERAGAHIVPVTIPNCAQVFENFRAGGLGAPELTDFLLRHLPDRIDSLDPLVKIRVQGVDDLMATDYLARVALFRQAARQADEIFRQVDAWITPTVLTTAYALDELVDPEAYRLANMKILHNPCIANLMHLCALTFPVGKDAHGIPVGLQLTGAAHGEEKLLALGLQCERVLGKSHEILGACPRW